MKHFLLYIIGIGLFLTSCDIETSDNGDLDGHWHLIRVDTLATGGSCNLSESRVFWGVQMRLIQAVDHDHDTGHYGYLFNFEHKGRRCASIMPISMSVHRVISWWRMPRCWHHWVSIRWMICLRSRA